MNSKLKISLSLILITWSVNAFNQIKESDFDRNAFYQAMQSTKIEIVNSELNALKSLTVAGKSAYEGALIMKKAGLSSNPSKKLNLFKSGHRQLEGAIKQDSANTEFRFLRLMVQEHAPDVLGSNKEIERDSDFVRKTYKKMSQAVQDVIIEYSKKSKVLKL
jgi:hypothetical protein